MELLSPNLGTIFWTVLTFILLILLLKKFAWKPILKVLDDRENRIKSSLYQAEQDKIEAEKQLAEQKRLVEKAKKESLRIINESKESAEKSRKELMEQSRQDAERLLERARMEIEQSKETAIAEVKKYAVELSLLAAKKVIGETLQPEQQELLIKQYLNELGPQQ